MINIHNSQYTKSKKGMALSTAVAITIALVVITSAIIAIASFNVDYTFKDLSRRQADVNVRSVLSYGESYYKDVKKVPKPTVGAGTATEYFLFYDDVPTGAYKCNDETDYNNNLSKAKSYLTATFDNTNNTFTLTGYSNYKSSVVSGYNNTSKLSLIYTVEKELVNGEMMDDLKPETAINAEYKYVNIHVKLFEGADFQPYIYTWGFENVNEFEYIANSSTSTSKYSGDWLVAKNGSDIDYNLSGPQGGMYYEGNGWYYYTIKLSKNMISETTKTYIENFNAIVTKKGALRETSDNAQTFELFALPVPEDTGENNATDVYVELKGDSFTDYKNTDLNNKPAETLNSAVSVYMRRPQTTVHFKVANDTAGTALSGAKLNITDAINNEAIATSSAIVHEGYGWYSCSVPSAASMNIELVNNGTTYKLGEKIIGSYTDKNYQNKQEVWYTVWDKGKDEDGNVLVDFNAEIKNHKSESDAVKYLIDGITVTNAEGAETKKYDKHAGDYTTIYVKGTNQSLTEPSTDITLDYAVSDTSDTVGKVLDTPATITVPVTVNGSTAPDGINFTAKYLTKSDDGTVDYTTATAQTSGGSVTFSAPISGKYYYRSTDDNYYKSEKWETAQVFEDGIVNYNDTTSTKAKTINLYKKATIHLYNKDTNNSSLDGGKIKVWGDNNFDSTYTFADGRTDFTPDQPGTYSWQMVTPASNYYKDSATYTFTIASNGSVTYSNNVDTIVSQKCYSVTITAQNQNGTAITSTTAAFALYDMSGSSPEKIADYSTNSDGLVQIFMPNKNTKYRIEEISAPNGYYVNHEVYSCTVDNNGKVNSSSSASYGWRHVANVSITITNKSADGKVISGGEFTFYNIDNQPIYTGVADENGKVTFIPDLYVNKDEASQVLTFTYCQTKTPSGYFNNNNEGIVTATYNQSTFAVTITNTLDGKKDTYGANKADIVFTNLSNNGKSLTIQLADKDGKAVKTTAAANVTEKGTANQNINNVNISNGKYVMDITKIDVQYEIQLTSIDANANYYLNKNTYTIQIDDTGKISLVGSSGSASIENDTMTIKLPQKVSLQINNVNATNNEILVDSTAQFKIGDETKAVSGGTALYDVKFNGGVAGTDGESCTMALAQVKAPDGYYQVTEQKNIVLTYDSGFNPTLTYDGKNVESYSTETGKAQYTLNFKNTKWVEFVINAYGGSNKTTPLSGVKFTVSGADITTDNNGQAFYTAKTPGTYTFTNSGTIDGYYLNETKSGEFTAKVTETGTETSSYDVHLAPYARVSMDINGLPRPDSFLTIKQEGDSTNYATATDAKGEKYLKGVQDYAAVMALFGQNTSGVASYAEMVEKVFMLSGKTAQSSGAYGTTESGANLTGGTKVYLIPNTNWTQASARFAIYVFYSDSNAWASMTQVSGKNYYEATIPAGTWANIIFCRMNGGTTDNSWGNKWNQTNDLTYDGTNNCYTIADNTWDKGDGTWSKIATGYTATATANDSNGTVSPTGAQTVSYGTDQKFTAAPITGYQVEKWVVNIGGTETTITSSANPPTGIKTVSSDLTAITFNVTDTNVTACTATVYFSAECKAPAIPNITATPGTQKVYIGEQMSIKANSNTQGTEGGKPCTTYYEITVNDTVVDGTDGNYSFDTSKAATFKVKVRSYIISSSGKNYYSDYTDEKQFTVAAPTKPQLDTVTIQSTNPICIGDIVDITANVKAGTVINGYSYYYSITVFNSSKEEVYKQNNLSVNSCSWTPTAVGTYSITANTYVVIGGKTYTSDNITMENISVEKGTADFKIYFKALKNVTPLIDVSYENKQGAKTIQNNSSMSYEKELTLGDPDSANGVWYSYQVTNAGFNKDVTFSIHSSDSPTFATAQNTINVTEAQQSKFYSVQGYGSNAQLVEYDALYSALFDTAKQTYDNGNKGAYSYTTWTAFAAAYENAIDVWNYMSENSAELKNQEAVSGAAENLQSKLNALAAPAATQNFRIYVKSFKGTDNAAFIPVLNKLNYSATAVPYEFKNAETLLTGTENGFEYAWYYYDVLAEVGAPLTFNFVSQGNFEGKAGYGQTKDVTIDITAETTDIYLNIQNINGDGQAPINYTDLNKAISNCKEVYSTGNSSYYYTADSWEAFETAYTNAYNKGFVYMAEVNLSQADVNKKEADLTSAFNGLKKESTAHKYMFTAPNKGDYSFILAPFADGIRYTVTGGGQTGASVTQKVSILDNGDGTTTTKVNDTVISGDPNVEYAVVSGKTAARTVSVYYKSSTTPTEKVTATATLGYTAETSSWEKSSISGYYVATLQFDSFFVNETVTITDITVGSTTWYAYDKVNAAGQRLDSLAKILEFKGNTDNLDIYYNGNVFDTEQITNDNVDFQVWYSNPSNALKVWYWKDGYTINPSGPGGDYSNRPSTIGQSGYYYYNQFISTELTNISSDFSLYFRLGDAEISPKLTPGTTIANGRRYIFLSGVVTSGSNSHTIGYTCTHAPTVTKDSVKQAEPKWLDIPVDVSTGNQTSASASRYIFGETQPTTVFTNPMEILQSISATAPEIDTVNIAEGTANDYTEKVIDYNTAEVVTGGKTVQLVTVEKPVFVKTAKAVVNTTASSVANGTRRIYVAIPNTADYSSWSSSGLKLYYNNTEYTMAKVENTNEYKNNTHSYKSGYYVYDIPANVYSLQVLDIADTSRSFTINVNSSSDIWYYKGKDANPQPGYTYYFDNSTQNYSSPAVHAYTYGGSNYTEWNSTEQKCGTPMKNLSGNIYTVDLPVWTNTVTICNYTTGSAAVTDSSLPEKSSGLDFFTGASGADTWKNYAEATAKTDYCIVGIGANGENIGDAGQSFNNRISLTQSAVDGNKYSIEYNNMAKGTYKFKIIGVKYGQTTIDNSLSWGAGDIKGTMDSYSFTITKTSDVKITFDTSTQKTTYTINNDDPAKTAGLKTVYFYGGSSDYSSSFNNDRWNSSVYVYWSGSEITCGQDGSYPGIKCESVAETPYLYKAQVPNDAKAIYFSNGKTGGLNSSIGIKERTVSVLRERFASMADPVFYPTTGTNNTENDCFMWEVTVQPKNPDIKWSQTDVTMQYAGGDKVLYTDTSLVNIITDKIREKENSKDNYIISASKDYPIIKIGGAVKNTVDNYIIYNGVKYFYTPYNNSCSDITFADESGKTYTNNNGYRYVYFELKSALNWGTSISYYAFNSNGTNNTGWINATYINDYDGKRIYRAQIANDQNYDTILFAKTGSEADSNYKTSDIAMPKDGEIIWTNTDKSFGGTYTNSGYPAYSATGGTVVSLSKESGKSNVFATSDRGYSWTKTGEYSSCEGATANSDAFRVGGTEQSEYYDWYVYRIPSGDTFSMSVSGLNGGTATATKTVTGLLGNKTSEESYVNNPIWLVANSGATANNTLTDVSVYTYNPDKSSVAVDQASKLRRVYFQNGVGENDFTANGGPYICYWGISEQNWPGQKMTADSTESGLYYADVPNDVAYMVFNDGNKDYENAEKTDVLWFTGECNDAGEEAVLYNAEKRAFDYKDKLEMYVHPMVKLNKTINEMLATYNRTAIYLSYTESNGGYTPSGDVKTLEVLKNKYNTAKDVLDNKKGGYIEQIEILQDYIYSANELVESIKAARMYLGKYDTSYVFPESAYAPEVSYTNATLKAVKDAYATAIKLYNGDTTALTTEDIGIKSYLLKQAVNNVEIDNSGKAILLLSDLEKWGIENVQLQKYEGGKWVAYNDTLRYYTNASGYILCQIDCKDGDTIPNLRFVNKSTGGMTGVELQGNKVKNYGVWLYDNQKNQWIDNTAKNKFYLSAESYEKGVDKEEDVTYTFPADEETIKLYVSYNAIVKYDGKKYKLYAGVYTVKKDAFQDGKINLFTDTAKDYFSTDVNFGFSDLDLSYVYNADDSAVGWKNSDGSLVEYPVEKDDMEVNFMLKYATSGSKYVFFEVPEGWYDEKCDIRINMIYRATDGTTKSTNPNGLITDVYKDYGPTMTFLGDSENKDSSGNPLKIYCFLIDDIQYIDKATFSSTYKNSSNFIDNNPRKWEAKDKYNSFQTTSQDLYYNTFRVTSDWNNNSTNADGIYTNIRDLYTGELPEIPDETSNTPLFSGQTYAVVPGANNLSRINFRFVSNGSIDMTGRSVTFNADRLTFGMLRLKGTNTNVTLDTKTLVEGGNQHFYIQSKQVTFNSNVNVVYYDYKIGKLNSYTIPYGTYTFDKENVVVDLMNPYSWKAHAISQTGVEGYKGGVYIK